MTRKTENRLLLLFAIACAMAVMGGCYILVTEQIACEERGGTYMKTFMSYECVDIKRK